MIHRKNLVRLIELNSHRHDRWRVFSDFVEMAAISLANAVDLRQRDAREARYMEIVRQYNADELRRFPEMLGELTMAMELEPGDVLGEAFMSLDLGSKYHGQFFTPYHLCRLMAKMNVDDTMRGIIEREGFIRVSEPACGGAAMIVALAEEMQAAGMNYQQQMHVVAQDLDIKAVHMAYIQLSLMHIPAVVIHGNTLALEERSHWYTPAHIMGGWWWRLAARDRKAAAQEQAEVPQKPSAPITLGAQLSLFEQEAA